MKLIQKRFKHFSPSTKAIIVFSLLISASFLMPIKEVPINIDGVLASTSIFYSILLGFYISASMSNLSRLKTLVATETGALISIYNIVKLSLPERVASVRKSIDKYLIKRFEYEVDNYTKPTTEEFFGIFEVLKGADSKSEGEGAAINYVAEAMYYVAQSRRELTIVGAKVVNGASWMLLNILSAVIVVCLFLVRDGSSESALICAFLSLAAVMALFILSDVDGNRFGEEKFAVDTYQDVFSAIGELNYYSKLYLEASRYKPKLVKYRTGSPSSIIIVDKTKNNKCRS